MPSAIGAYCGQCLCLNERSGNQMMPAETGSPANLAGRNLGCQESNGQHVSRPQGSSVLDRIGDRSLASRETRTHGTAPQETPERVFLDHLTDCLRLGGRQYLCSGLVRDFYNVRDFSEKWSLVIKTLTMRNAQCPWMVELHSKAREICGDVPDLGPNPTENADQLVAAMSRYAKTDGVTVAFEESLLESPAGPKQFLRLDKSATGAFSLLLAEDDGGNEIYSPTQKMQDLAARFAFSNVLERRYPGVLASVQKYRNFMARSGCLTLVDAQKIWNAVKVQHEVELCNGGKSFKDRLVRENAFLCASESLPSSVGPLECVIARDDQGLSLMPGSGQDAARILYLPPAKEPLDSLVVTLPLDPGENDPRIIMIMNLCWEYVGVRHNLDSLSVFHVPKNLIDEADKRETDIRRLLVDDAVTWLVPSIYFDNFDGAYRKIRPTNSVMYSYGAEFGANFFGEFAVAPGESTKSWHFYVQNAASNIVCDFFPLSAPRR